jgi:hypothetical protein
MNQFRNDPHWQQYWEDRRRDQKVSMYAFAPFLEVAAIMIRGSATLELQFRRKRTKELVHIAYALEERAQHLRGNGIGWLVRSLPGYSPLVSAIHKRMHFGGDTPVEPHGEAAERLLSMAISFLFLFESTFMKIEREIHEESSTAVWFFDKLETLTDLSGSTSSCAVDPRSFQVLGRHATMLECEGLAYAQAMIEDGFTKKSGTKKSPQHVDEEMLTRLSDDIDVPIETLREVFGQTYSGWWKVKEEYRSRAIKLRDEFIDTLPSPTIFATVYRAAWDLGSVHLNTEGYPHCFGNEEFAASEQVTKQLIAMFLAFPDIGEAKQRAIK